MDTTAFRQQTYNTLLSLATEEGINASGKQEIYGCIFGRDSFITILKILKVASKTPSPELLEICKRALLTHTNLQGKECNIESGEEPGKFIHEFRRNNYEEIMRLYGPRVIYPDNTMRNYDSIDSTPLGLIAMYRFWQITQDGDFLLKALPAVEQGLNWIISYGDRDKDSLLEYEFPQERTYSGSLVQSWTDSEESLKRVDGSMPPYPLAPVEVQGYAWLALKLWGDFYANGDQQFAHTEKFAQKLKTRATELKKRFNELFLFETNNFIFPAQALDGVKNQIKTITGNPLLLLWAKYEQNGKGESILEDKYIQDVVSRSFLPDLFDDAAGIRTMSTTSATYNPTETSYHNGSFWPKLNGLAHEGLVNFNFEEEAALLKAASLKPLHYFGTPIELYIKDQQGSYLEWRSPQGHMGCKVQAWSAAALLDFLTF